MELYVSHQLLQLVCSAAVGIGIGLVYDVFRILRRCLKADALFDALFWLCCLAALFTLGMDMGEGALHIFMLAFAVLGFASYMLLLSTPVMTVLYKIAHIVSPALSPLKKIRFPVHELAMMMSIALRFIPTLIEETDKIISAQKARGADFETGNIFRRAKALIPILVPLFVSAFRRADELATAMECRCYHGDEGRTKLNVLHYQTRDYLVLGYYAVLVAAVIALR